MSTDTTYIPVPRTDDALYDAFRRLNALEAWAVAVSAQLADHSTDTDED